MVVHYSSERLQTIWNSKSFIDEYEKYKIKNKLKIDKLLNINKIDFKLSNISDEIKRFKNLLNKLSITNINTLQKDIQTSITEDILEECILIIIDKCISEPNYINLYIPIIIDITKKYTLDIRYIINSKLTKVFESDIITDELSQYDTLCKLNKKMDESTGLCILIVELEKNFLINDSVKPTLDKFIKNLDISNPETREKYIHSLYSIFSKLDPRFIILYETKLLEIKNSNIERKHKFKIMDILDLKK